MSAPARFKPFRFRNALGLVFGVGFLIGAAVALGAYVNRFGFDGPACLGIAVAAADAWLLARAIVWPGPSRPGTFRSWAQVVVLLVALLGPVALVILAYAPILVRASTVNADRALLVVVGLLLFLVLAAVGLGGRRLAKEG